MNPSFKYLALGDSYTIGEGITHQESWPMLLEHELKKINNTRTSTKIIAQTGWSCEELMDAIQMETVSNHNDLVSICVGVNDQYRGYPVESFKISFTKLLLRSITFAQNKKENIVVLSIPNWSVTPFAKSKDQAKIAQEIKEYNLVKKSVCEQNQISFINITDLTKIAGNDISYLAKDGLHYSKKMHQLWVDEVLKNLKR